MPISYQSNAVLGNVNLKACCDLRPQSSAWKSQCILLRVEQRPDTDLFDAQ
jgi:hypothetical protein